MPMSRQSFWAAMLDGLGEGRVGELHLGELLDVHARAHGGRDDLDGFS